MHNFTGKSTIAVVIDKLSRGGAEKIALSLANNLDRERYKCIFITTREPGEMASDLKKDVEHFSLYRKTRFDLKAVKRLATFFDQKQVAIVHSFNHSSSYFCRVVRLFCKNKWYHIFHDRHGPAVDSWKLALLDRFFLSKVDFCIAVSPALTKRAIKTIGLAENKCRYLPNSITVPEVLQKPRNDIIKIVQVGRIEPVKNHLMSVKTAAIMKRNSIPFEWLFVGRDSNKKCTREISFIIKRERLENQIKLMGEIANVSEILEGSDIGVLTSTHEGFSNAMLEYMAHGLPIVITDVGHSSDIIRNASGGFVVPQNDHIEAAKMFSQLIADEKLRIKLGKNNRKYVASNFNEKSMIGKIMEIYDSLIY